MLNIIFFLLIAYLLISQQQQYYIQNSLRISDYLEDYESFAYQMIEFLQWEDIKIRPR